MDIIVISGSDDEPTSVSAPPAAVSLAQQLDIKLISHFSWSGFLGKDIKPEGSPTFFHSSMPCYSLSVVILIPFCRGKSSLIRPLVATVMICPK